MTSAVTNCHNHARGFPLRHKATPRNVDRMSQQQLRLGLGLPLCLRFRGLGIDDPTNVLAREPGVVDDVDLFHAVFGGFGTDGLKQFGAEVVGLALSAVVRGGKTLQLRVGHRPSMPHRHANHDCIIHAAIVGRLHVPRQCAYYIGMRFAADTAQAKESS